MACSTVHLFVLPSSPQDSNPLFSSSTRRFISGLSACSLHRRTCILYIPPDTNDMETFELEYCRGRWLAPLEVIDELYDALLRLPAKGQTDYITLGSRDSDVEICCATKPKKFAKEPFAYTEAEAHTKLSAWRQKSDLNVCDCGSDSTGEKTAASKPTQDSPDLNFARTEAEAVRLLRERGYIIAPPRVSVGEPGSVTPPPPYALHLSSSQPVRSVARQADTPSNATEKRKRERDHNGDGVAALATSCPSTPTRRLNSDDVTPQNDREVTDVGPEAGAGDDDDDDEPVAAPQRKKRKTLCRSTASNTTKSLPQEPTSPPRRTKTKRKTLTSTISYEAAAELIGAAQETVDTASTDADNDADVSDGDPGEGSLQDTTLEDINRNRPPASSPEEIGALNLLSLSISAPNTPAPELPADGNGDSLFIPEDAAEPSQLARPETSTLSGETVSKDPIPDTTIPSAHTKEARNATGVASWSAEDRRLYRHFCEDVKTAEVHWDHSSTRQGMARLRGREPLLEPTFLKCLAIARRTMSEDVVHEWRNFQAQGWEKRQRFLKGLGRIEKEDSSSSLSAVEAERRDVVAEAYRHFQDATRANTNTWKARFQYRRAAIRLAVQYETYADLRIGHVIHRSSALQQDRSMLLHALFREMHPDWRDALPDGFTERQAKDQGYIYEWRAFNQTIQDGRRWNILAEGLGLGALLLIDTSRNNDYIQRQAPIPVFSAWAQLIPRVRLDVKEVAARVEGYYDGMEDPSFYAARKLRPLKLERRAYRAQSPGEQFEFSGSEGGRTPTTDPSCLMQLGEDRSSIYERDYAMDDFIRSSSIDDEDFAVLSGDTL